MSNYPSSYPPPEHLSGFSKKKGSLPNPDSFEPKKDSEDPNLQRPEEEANNEQLK